MLRLPLPRYLCVLSGPLRQQGIEREREKTDVPLPTPEKVPLLALLCVKRNLNLQSNTCGFVIHLPRHFFLQRHLKTPLKTSLEDVKGSGSWSRWIQCTGRILEFFHVALPRQYNSPTSNSFPFVLCFFFQLLHRRSHTSVACQMDLSHFINQT